MAKVSGCVLLTAYWLSRETIFGTSFWSSMNRFVTFRLFGEKIGRLSKLHSIIPEGRFAKKGLIVLACLPILHSRNLKMIFRGKQSFKERSFFCLFQTLSENLRTLAKFSWLRSLNCILHIQRNILRKFFLMFDDQLCQFWTFWKKNSEWFFKTAFYRAQRIAFKEKNYFFKKTVFFQLFWTWS